MSKSMIKIMILSIVLLAIIGLVTLLAITKLKVGTIETMSIKDISKSKADLVKANSNLVQAGQNYGTKINSLDTVKTEYKTEKAKYESISEGTISIIQDATKDEKYFIEYLWITLGNYAKAHSLKLTVVDPGSKVTSDLTKAAAPATTPTTGTTTTPPATTTTTTTTGTPATTPAATPATTTGAIAAKDNVVTIQLKGSYLKVADFVFEVENDKTLRFKLDNISMKTAGGTDIIASFEVKSLVIIK